VLAAVHYELAYGDLATLLERIVNDRVALVGFVDIRHEVIGLLEITAAGGEPASSAAFMSYSF
jgi:hypothetical protein